MLSKLQRRAIFYSGIENDLGIDIRQSFGFKRCLRNKWTVIKHRHLKFGIMNSREASPS